MRRGLIGALGAALWLVAPAAASAARSSVLAGQTLGGGAIPCTAQSDGVRVCHGTDTSPDMRLKSFDGAPLEVYVILPPASASSSDGSYPLIVQSHGWGGHAGGPNDGYGGPTADAWAARGYAVIQLTARGFGDSCGKAASRLVSPQACMNGYLRLDDLRYEVRDIQYAAGLLVDEGIVDPGKIGATGESYGGGVSLELATLKDRVMDADGSLRPWTSPHGTPISLAAAAPIIPWSDLVASLMPSGRTLDYGVTSMTADLSPIGVEKQSFVSGLYLAGTATGYYAPPMLNPQADLTTWFGLFNSGEPYEGNPAAETIGTQFARYHSAYYLLGGAYGEAQEAPAPLLIANGFTDDLFPVDEAVRYYNLERSLYPSDPISLLDLDFGHMRAQNKPADAALLSGAVQTLFDHYLQASGLAPASDATATIETCPSSAPSGGPFTAASWSALHPGEVDFSAGAAQTITSGAGNPAIGQAIDPITGKGACATAPAADQGTGVASFRLPAAGGPGYTLLGSPTVIATLKVTGTFPEIAERLWDIDPATQTETLVARGVYRVDSAHPDGSQVFQLHPGAWHFAAGHIPKLEFLSQDTPYVRASNGTFSISVSDLQLRLPVHEPPGSAPGVVTPAPPFGTPCDARPSSKLARKRTHLSHRGAIVRGSAGEQPCAGIGRAQARAQRVRRVLISISLQVGHGRCRFLERHGRLSRPGACRRPITIRAHGTRHFTLRLRFAIPAGRYVVRSDAVDGRHRHQRRSRASQLKVRVR